MGGGDSKEVHHYHTTTVYKPDPETTQKLKETEDELKKMEEDAIKLKSPEYFVENSTKLFSNFIDELPKLALTESINKKAGDFHIAIGGPVTAGKTTFVNVLFNLTLPTALGHCTSECQVVHKVGDIFVWDLVGSDNSFKFFDPETLSFIKSLDKCVIMFDNDISMVSWMLKTVYTINPDSLVIVRTKIDQYTANDIRTIEEEKKLDKQKVKNLLGKDIETFCISSHNVRDGKERHDWNKLKTILSLD